jgi:pimeloyl-ACP methyl ester carboxylesterase
MTRGALRYQSVATDILALANHLQLQRFAVVGWSSGGCYALAAAAYLPPHRCVRVTTVSSDPPWKMVPWATFNVLHVFLLLVRGICHNITHLSEH